MTSASARTLAAVVLCLGIVAGGLPAIAFPAGVAPPGATALSAGASAAGAPDFTYVESDVTEDTTWTAEDGPYRIAADVTVEEGATLRIEPGTAVQPAADISVRVEGNLTAAGTASDPVTFSTAPEAPADVRWASIRYAGTPRSHLSLSNVTVEMATNALTVGSSAGRVEVVDTVVRNVSRNGVRVVNATGTPELTVAGSSFTDVGERGVAVTPGTGAVGGARVTSNSSVPGNRTEHQLALTPGADVTMDAFRVAYRGHGNVGAVDRGSFRKFGLDLNGNGTVERSLLDLVTAVEHSRANSYEIRLAHPVTVPADATIRAAYDDVVNPSTYGTYPVAVGLRANGVEQTAATTLPFDLRSSAATDRDENTAGRNAAGGSGVAGPNAPPSRAARFAVRDSTFESIGEQGVFVAADAARRFRIADNEFSDLGGSGLALRGRRVGPGVVAGNRISAVGRGGDGVRVAGRGVSDLRLRRNRVSGADAAVGLYARDANVEGVRFVSNVVTDSTTGFRVRHRGSYYPTRLSVTLADNEVADNDRRGVSVVARAAKLRGVTVRGNDVANNGNTGLLLDGGTVARTTVRNNTVEGNGGAGVRFDASRVVRATVADNTFARNRGDGFAVGTSLAVHDVSVASNRALDNAGVGLNVSNRLTHAGAVNVTRNLVAANAYGVRVAGTFGGRIANNTVVYNTYGLAEPVQMSGYRPGTGIVVEEGDAGAIFRTGDVDEELAQLVDDPEVEAILERRSPDEYTVVLRPGKRGDVWASDEGALTVGALSEDIPTGVVLRKDGDRRQAVVVRHNDVYGHVRGMTVNVGTLVDANTTTRLFVNATRTVAAERNYWGASDGPTHASIHPGGTGDRVVTRRGWVDFVPPASSPFGPRYHRPVANLTASPNPVAVGERVAVSGAGSRDADGDERVGTYRFVAPDSRPNRTGPNVTVSSDPAATVSFPRTGNYTVSLTVEDELGVESADAATVTVRALNASATPETTAPDDGTGSGGGTTTGTARGPDATTTVAAETGGGLLPSPAALTTLGGLLGLVFYVAALALGGYGAVQTFRRLPVAVDGRVINGCAAAGVAVWVAFGLAGTDGLLALGGAGGVVWVALVALLWAATRRLY